MGVTFALRESDALEPPGDPGERRGRALPAFHGIHLPSMNSNVYNNGALETPITEREMRSLPSTHFMNVDLKVGLTYLVRI